MSDATMTRKQLVEELQSLRSRVDQLERERAERDRAEEHLQESEHFLADVFECIQDGISVLDADLTIRRVNGVMNRWYAKNLPLEGKKCYECYHDRNSVCDPCPTVRCLQSGRTECEIIPGLSGSPAEWIELFSYPVKDPASGKVTGVVQFARDVTDRKRAEQARQRSEARLRQVLDLLPDMVFAKDREGRFLLGNRAGAESVGLTVEELTGKRHADVHPDPDQVRRMLAEDRQVIESGRPLTIPEEPYLDAAGNTRWLRTTKVPYIAADTSEPAVLGVAVDITERRQAEQALRESEQRFRELAENIDEVLWLTDWRSRTLIYVNPAYEKVYGRTRESLYQDRRSWLEPVHPDDRARIDALFARKGALGEYTEAEYRIVHAGGAVRWIRDRSIPVRDAAGDVCRWVGVAEDITERKRAEEALRTSEERYRLLVETMGEGLAIHERGRLTYVNDSFCRMLGYSRDELIGRPRGSFLDEANRAILEEQMAKRREGEWGRYEIEFTAKDGRQVATLVAPRPMLREEPGYVGSFAIFTDISQRKQAEEALRERDAMIRALVETSRDWIWSIDPQGRHTFCNPAVEAILGYRPDELIGESSFDFMHDDDRRAVEVELPGNVAEKRGWRNVLLRWRHKQGGYRYLESNAVPILDAAGELIGFRGVDRDITKRRQAEQALRDERDKAQRYLDIAAVMLIVVGADQNVKLVNKKGCEILGYPEGDIVGKNWFDHFLPVQAKDEVKSVFRSLVAGEIESVEYFENAVLTRDGQERMIAWHNTALRDADGKTIGTLSSGEDITDRKRAEEDLQRSEIRFRHIAESMADWIWEVDAKGVYTYASAKVGQILGYSSEEILGRTPFDLMPPDEADRTRRLFAEIAGRKEPIRDLENWNLTKDGKLVCLLTNCTPLLGPGGELLGYRGVDRDITDRKRAEAELARYRDHLEELVEQRTGELEASREQIRRTEHLASLGTLAAGMAHEINNPVGGILLAAENALGARGRPGTDALTEVCLKDIVNHARRCGGIVQNVLRFARQETTEKHPGNLNVIVERAVMLTARHSAEHGAAVERRLADKLPQVSFNSLEMEQVLVNLIRNAVASGARGVRVVIATEHVGQVVRTTVRDDGPGIPPKHLQHVFDPFFTARRESGGTGLGLSIVHGTVTDHGGTIDVQSQLGLGTTFTIDLPVSTSGGTEVPDAETAGC